MAALQPIYLAFAMRGPSKKAIIAMTSRDGAPKYFGVLKKNVNQISVSDIHNGAKIDFVFVLFLNSQIWPLCSQFTWPLQWEVRQKRPLLPWPRGTVPPNTLVSWKKVNQISISDIHTGAEIDFDILFQIDVHSQIWPLCSQFTWPLQWEVRPTGYDLEGWCPKILWSPEKNVNQISVSDIHNRAISNFNVLYQI